MNGNSILGRERRFLIVSAWMLMLLVSDLPDILLVGFFDQVPGWLFWSKVGLLGAFLGLCLLWKALRPLWQYAVVIVVFYLALSVSTEVGSTQWWQDRFGGEEVSFTVGYVGAYLRDVGVALIVIVALWILKRRRSEFFLVVGQLDAPIEPVRWLGIREGESWRTFGWVFSLVAGLVTLIVVALTAQPTLETLSRAAPLLPAVLLFAAINAFTEEIYFRVAFLSTLSEAIGRAHTLLITSVFFGLAHYLYGSPPGMTGFLMTGFLAWLMGKSILETRGLFWAWLIHFLPDVVIFAWYAIAWVAT